VKTPPEQETTHWPFACLLLGASAVAVHWIPAWGYALEDRNAALTFASAAEFWRPWSGDLTHRSLAHLILNLSLFLLLACARERRRGSLAFLGEYLLLASFVAIGVRLCHSDWESYRGLSGVVYGLLVLYLLDSPRTSRDVFLVACIGAKTLLEVYAGGWLHWGTFLDTSLAVKFLPGSHAGGIAGGILIAWATITDPRVEHASPALHLPRR